MGITAYLKAYPEEKKKNVNGVLRAEKNIVTLLKHISGEMNRRTALPSRADVNQLGDELAFKQSQFENAESTLQRVQLELNERKQDLERVEELERKMNQEMDNLKQKMEEMYEEIKIFENIGALKSRAQNEKQGLDKRRKGLRKRRDALKIQLRVQTEEFERNKQMQDHEKLNELDTIEKKIKAMEDNLFVMREFVSEKGAETNFGPLQNEVRGLGAEINSMLCEMQQKAA